jgi:hypothetical protein
LWPFYFRCDKRISWLGRRLIGVRRPELDFFPETQRSSGTKAQKKINWLRRWSLDKAPHGDVGRKLQNRRHASAPLYLHRPYYEILITRIPVRN